MELNIPFEHKQTLIKPEIEEKNMNDYQSIFKKPLSAGHNSFINFPKQFMYKPLNKNGFNKKEVKIESNHFSWTESETPSNKPILNNFDFNDVEIPLNQQNADVNNNNRYKSKTLEPKLINSTQLNIINQNPDYQNHFYQNKRDIELYNYILGCTPIISREFSSKEKAANNIYISKEKVIKDFIRKLSAQKTKKCITKQKTQIKNQSSKKTYFNVDKKEANGQNELALCDIPENFLVDFSLKKIIIKDLQKFKEIKNPLDCIYLEDMEDFMIQLCNNIVNINKSEKSINLEDEEYIEFLKFEKTEENLQFLQKKRSNNSGFDDIENLYGEERGENKNKNKKKATKKTKKKTKKTTIKDKKIIKMNNKKDGLKINLYLNQIQINNINLENFPFFPLLGIKENIKIEFLKGIINKKKNLIKINKKAEYIKDQRNLQYIRKKKFEVFYANKENNRQYVLYINEFHILHLILYYYYKIQQGIRLMNKYHYSHSSFEKSQRVTKQIESLIKKCNKIVEIITYKKDF
jgi:hypothetical protein